MVAIAQPDILYQSLRQSSATSRGYSWWQVAGACGRKRLLTTQHAEMLAEEKSENLRIGSYYAALKEHWLKGKIPDGTAMDLRSIQDSDFAESLRLFEFYTEHFGKDYWGELLGIEVQLPVDSVHRRLTVDFFGVPDDLCPTGALDSLRRLSADDVRRLEADRKITLRGPGLYSVDDKTAGARMTDIKALPYTHGPQATQYMTIWNLAGGEPILGTILDVIVKHVDLRRHDESPKKLSSIQTLFTPYTEETPRVAKAMISEAYLQYQSGRPNPYSCIGEYGMCVFFNKGLCGRY